LWLLFFKVFDIFGVISKLKFFYTITIFVVNKYCYHIRHNWIIQDFCNDPYLHFNGKLHLIMFFTSLHFLKAEQINNRKFKKWIFFIVVSLGLQIWWWLLVFFSCYDQDLNPGHLGDILMCWILLHCNPNVLMHFVGTMGP